jgi:Ca2+-binding RTX toxin-like protein
VKGEAGDDTIIAGPGDDNLFGGKGRDIFAFTDPDDGVDRIRDFKVKQDRIGLDDGSFAALGATVEAAEFVLGTEALTAEHHLIHDRDSGKLWWDADGAGGAGRVLLARLTDGTKLGAANFHMDDFT